MICLVVSVLPDGVCCIKANKRRYTHEAGRNFQILEGLAVCFVDCIETVSWRVAETAVCIARKVFVLFLINTGQGKERHLLLGLFYECMWGLCC